MIKHFWYTREGLVNEILYDDLVMRTNAQNLGSFLNGNKCLRAGVEGSL